MGSVGPGTITVALSLKEMGTSWGSDAEEMALLQHPTMLSSPEFRLWEIRELISPVVVAGNHTNLSLWWTELGIYAIWYLLFLLIMWAQASYLTSVWVPVSLSAKQYLPTIVIMKFKLDKGYRYLAHHCTKQGPNKCLFLLLSMIMSFKFTSETVKDFSLF